MRMNRHTLVLSSIIVIACKGNDTSDAGNTELGAMTTGGPSASTGLPSGGTSTVGSGANSDGAPTVSDTGGPPAGSTTPTGGPPTGGTSTGTGATTTTTGTGTSSGNPTVTSSTGTSTAGTSGGGAGGMPPVGSGETPAGGAPETGGGGGGGGGDTDPGLSICPYTAPTDPASFPEGWTSGDVTVFNSNGGWTWYNDERVVVDAEGGKIIVSSAQSDAANQGSNPNIDAVIHDLASGANEKMLLGSLPYSDDHNNGGILVLGAGEYFVGWAHHNKDCISHWRNYAGGAWGAEQKFDWSSLGCPWAPPEGSGANPSNITYNNPWKIDGRYYNFVRGVESSPSILGSDDGKAWALEGRLTASPRTGYNAGYYKFWGNNVDRVDFFATEAHPRDADTSVYHGYVQGTKSYNSSGTELDDTVLDTEAPQITEYTKVFSSGSMIGGVTLHNLWNFDIVRYEDGTLGALWQGREVQCADKNNCDPKHHVVYSRFDGTEWKATYLVKGGRTLYRNRTEWWEEDYLGGAALDPDDPHVIYVSTNIDPRDNTTEYPVNEIWKGVSCDDGASFVWTPVTMNSKNENLRPVVPKWDASNHVLAWFRGNYQTAQMYSAEVVGIITRE
jgi:hypothetical protein